MEDKEDAKELLNNQKIQKSVNGCADNCEQLSVDVVDKGSAPQAPKDKYYFVYMIFLLHGIGILLPWNVFINANNYFVNYKLNTTASYDADYRRNFLVYIGMASQIPNLLLSAFNVFFQSGGDSSTQGLRFIIAVLVNIGVLAITIVLAVVDSSEWPDTFFALTIICVVVLNSCTGVYQSFAFGLAALLPMRYSNAVVIGTNFCGTIVAVCNIITQAAAGGTDPDGGSIRTGAIYYFVVAIVILLLCFDTYFILPHLRFYRFYTKKKDQGKSEESTPLEAIEKTDKMKDGDVDVEGAQELSSLNVLRNCFSVCCFCPLNKGVKLCSGYWKKYLYALRHCWVHCLSVFSIFFCTLSVFPELMSKVKPQTKGFMGRWFTDVSCFLFFNMFALFGNLISNFVQKPGPKYLWIIVWIRTLFFIPFFILCNVSPEDRVIPAPFQNEWVYIIGVVIMALTSGYLSSLGMMYAPASAPADLKSIAGMLAAFSLVLGVFIGVQMSLLWTNIVVGKA